MQCHSFNIAGWSVYDDEERLSNVSEVAVCREAVHCSTFPIYVFIGPALSIMRVGPMYPETAFGISFHG